MPEFLQPTADLARSIWDQYHQIPAWIRACFQPLKMGAACLFLEYLSGGRLKQYLSRGFGQDLAYWLWHGAGLYKMVFSSWILVAVTPYVAVFDLKLLNSLPYVARGIVFYLIAEFIAYWYHRWQHASRFLWAFHSTHHSQQRLNFATFNRFHPVDEFLMEWLTFVPLLMLGATVTTWMPLFYVHKIIAYGQHSEVNWRFGWLERFFVSPMFHSAHHSDDPKYFNRNFGATISLWDHIFGTAVVIEKRPERYGLADYPSPTLVSSLVTPFQLLWRYYFARHGSAAGNAAVPATPASTPGSDG